ncbi:uncharacterized protein DUF2490 [Lutibacter sp. Hel_I_33_5]|uniref:DUF2490 domain-containing protein n=1 Tax=Lutibacter sp. Hel_I_33_5 TaxID=1566289 RepID=UPI0011AA7594|nr:DUF2490 domain-containing protein [Lutibacter sp. Hel_I_33_5]TVZ55279.1 uncharacterized protein DUF2490 [Lutibacter sp. Hel_I_33_5]
MKKLLLASFILLFTAQNFAQSNAEKELGVWYMFGGSHKLSEKLTIKSLAHFRFFEFGDDMQQLLLRAGLNYKLSDHFSVLAGYAFLNTDATYDLDGGKANEHRIYEDLYASHKISKLSFAHRIRLEHRFFKTNTNNWIRYQLGLSHPIDDKWSAYVYDEVFFNFSGQAYTMNWLGAGFKYKISKSTKLQLGYMNISTVNANFNRLQVGVSFSTNHIKKRKI